MMKNVTFTITIVWMSSLAAADEPALLRPPLWVDADDENIPEPAEREVSEIYDPLRNTWLRHLDLGYIGLKLVDRPAMNVNAWDEVPDSSWFTNRIGVRPLSAEELVAGAPGKAPVGRPWEVYRLKTQGYTPGFRFRDAAGEAFVLKFDPDAPERNSAADEIGSLIMHAAGYNAPQNTIVIFRPEDLVVAEDAQYEDILGRRRPMTPTDLEAALSTLQTRADGSYRALTSHFLPGIPKGHFPYWGTRKDDPNDLIPHELRRELRGLKVIASWFNHVDVKEVNNHEAYIQRPEGGGYLRHNFIDFGSTMGAGSFMNGPRRVGHEYVYDGAAIGKSLITFGAYQRPWELEEGFYPEVGHFESELFDPASWKPNYPNLAFQETDAGDAYWGAKIVTAFNDELVKALVDAGQYSRPEVRAYVEKVFRERRDKIGAYWFGVVTPLEAFELESGSDAGPLTLRFRDIAVERGYAEASSRRYQFVLRDPSTLEAVASIALVADPEISIDRSHLKSGLSADRFGRNPGLVVDIWLDDARPVRVVIGQNAEGELEALGWEHAPKS